MAQIIAQPETDAWQLRIVATGTIDPKKLIQNPKNWRAHPDQQRASFNAVIRRLGWVRSILLQDGTDVIIDGHMRVSEAIKSGQSEVPVEWVNLTDAEVTYALQILDPMGAMAEVNREQFDANVAALVDLSEHERHMFSLFGAGTQPAMFKTHRTLGQVSEEEVDDVPAVPRRDSVVETGESWRLGRHVLMCGDSTIQSMVDQLMRGASADLVFTDPPYNVDYQGGMTVAEAKLRHRRTDGLEIGGDNQSSAELASFLHRAFDAVKYVLRPGGVFYICSPPGDTEFDFRWALRQAALQLRQVLVWQKDVFVMGRQDYHWQHESILYGWREGAGHHQLEDRTQSTLWVFSRPRRSREHPTMKPVALVQRAIENSSTEGGIVVDLFGGSGTTIFAAERANRLCRCMEKDRHYAEVTLDRWFRLTGEEPVRFDGVTLGEVYRERGIEREA